MRVGKNTAIVVLALLWMAVGLSAAQDTKPAANADELVAKHLDSIASPEIRAGLKTRAVQGPVHFAILIGGAGTLTGKAFLVSEGNKLQLMIKLPSTDYNGEQFVFNGEKNKIGLSTSRQSRSDLGTFVFDRNEILREGLLGGTLSTAWPLLNLNERQAKLNFHGLKKIDGQKLYELLYHPHKSTDLEIKLYFDPQTYRHVETIYTYVVPTAMTGGGPAAVASQQASRYQLLEKFSDFKTVDGVTLPTRDDIQFSREPQMGRTSLSEWDMTGLEVMSNISLDPRNFEVN
jgi:hypothetical protein